MMRPAFLLALCCTLPTSLSRAEELANRTTLSDSSLEYRVPAKPYVVLQRANVRAVVVDNQAVDDDILPKHRAGYSGIASLTHTKQRQNLFVPSYAGLNYEHIHDGTKQDRTVLFEPRNAPMELRVLDEHTAELYQAPTPHWGLESCLRYHMLEDGAIEMTLECIPRRRTFKHDYIGLFWASYIHQPESLDIHLKGHKDGSPRQAKWLRGITPRHGVLATHIASTDNRRFEHDVDFPLTLAFNRSQYRFAEPWYFGISRGMALALMFRPQDEMRLTQSPSGGGQGNPAWDFQYFIANYKIGQRYQMVMRAKYVPFQSAVQMEQATAHHRLALADD